MIRRVLVGLLAAIALLLPVGRMSAPSLPDFTGSGVSLFMHGLKAGEVSLADDTGLADGTGTRFAAAAVREAYFYSEKNGASVFAVPYTYCVEVLGEEGEWLKAAYAADSGIYRRVYGYCRRDDFILLDGVPEYTYLYKAVGVQFKPDAESGSLPALDVMSVEAAYYGVYRAGGELYSYVYCRGSFGYIYGANDDYPLNELPQKDTFEETEPPAEDEKKGGFNGTALVCALVICALFAGVALMLFFTARRPRKM